jgi:hypothetical protein
MISLEEAAVHSPGREPWVCMRELISVSPVGATDIVCRGALSPLRGWV